MSLTCTIVSLGCPRNLVDSEVILGILDKAGYKIAELKDAEIAIVNTCTFIKEAEAESIDIIMQLASLKKEGRLSCILVCGCMPQRYGKLLTAKLPEVDGFFGTCDYPKVPEIIEKCLKGSKPICISQNSNFIYDPALPRYRIGKKHFTYIKISEGCDHGCSFCVISKARGRFRSRPLESVVEEITALPEEVKEINLVGQDTMSYGKDLYGKPKIAELLDNIASRPSDRWIRLLYGHPQEADDGLVKTFKKHASLCRYLDLPIQHINNRILKLMNRNTTKKQIYGVFERLRGEIPDLAIRTALLVGFPGETDEEFEELLDFVREMKFERLGIFIYSKEEGSRAARFSEQIPQKIKQARFDEIMKAQQEIARGNNERLLGREVKVLIDEAGDDPNTFIGRTEWDAPEVDGEVWVKASAAPVGEFVNVRISDTLEYDLVGELTE